MAHQAHHITLDPGSPSDVALQHSRPGNGSGTRHGSGCSFAASSAVRVTSKCEAGEAIRPAPQSWSASASSIAFNVSSTVPRTISPRWSRIQGFIDLDHLTHRILVTHRLLLHCMKKPSVPKVRKILTLSSSCSSLKARSSTLLRSGAEQRFVISAIETVRRRILLTVRRGEEVGCFAILRV